MSVELAGRDPDAVLRLLEERRARKERGEPIADTSRLALVIEGGAMRGVYTAGAAFALAERGYADLFDAVYAASSGAVNAAYFLAGQARFAVGTYYEDLCGREFINPYRFWKMVDIDYIERQVFTHRKFLDEAALRASRTQFFVGLTECASGEAVAWHVQAHTEPLARVLKASTALPVVYNKVVELGGRKFVDGGLANPVPIDWALAGGATHCLVLLSRPMRAVQGPPNWRQRAVFRFLFRQWNRRLQRTFEGRWDLYQKSLDRALGRGPDPVSATVATLLPADDVCDVSALTRDPAVLRTATDQMARGVQELLQSRAERRAVS